MDIEALSDPDVQSFIQTHLTSDVKALALKKPPVETWPYTDILNQIKVRQKARDKAPEWCDVPFVLFPSDNLFQQASSEACARYKASLLRGKSCVDLTGGCGIDAWYVSEHFQVMNVVERDAQAYEILRHNFTVLQNYYDHVSELKVSCDDAESFLHEIGRVDVVMIDPQRRDSSRQGLYDFSACSPNVIEMLPALNAIAKRVLVKASPVLDIEKAMRDLGHVVEVHVVQWRGECKEVLYLLDFARVMNLEDIMICAVDLDDVGQSVKKFQYTISEERTAQTICDLPHKYIYEPGPAFQKSGGFCSISKCYNVSKLHPHTHLYSANSIIDDFPGKRYELLSVLPVKRDALDVDRADIAIRNFPSTPEMLRKKLKLRDGGDHRIYATTLSDGSKKLLLCRK